MDFLREIGMIYVVVATLVIILLGIVAFMIYVERRLSSIENNLKT